MIPGLMVGSIGRAAGGGGSPLAMSGTMREGETLTASGGTGGPYTWKRVSDGATIGSGASHVLTASEVGEVPQLDDGSSTVDGTEVGSSALFWLSSADGVSGTGIPSRGPTFFTVGEGATAPTYGSDVVGPYVDFAGANGLVSPSLPGLFGSDTDGDYTFYVLADNDIGADQFVGELYQSSKRLAIQLRSTGDWRVLNPPGGYQALDAARDETCELSVFTLRMTASEMSRSMYHGAVRAAADGIAYTGQDHSSGAGSTQVGFGSLISFTTSWQSKVRFFACYLGTHDATKQAEVRAALARVWPHVDKRLDDYDLIVDQDARAGISESGGAMSSWTNQGRAGGTVSALAGSPTYDAAGMNGLPTVQGSGSGSVEMQGTLPATGDGTWDEHTCVLVANWPSVVNGGRVIRLSSLSGGYPEVRELTSDRIGNYPTSSGGGLLFVTPGDDLFVCTRNRLDPGDCSIEEGDGDKAVVSGGVGITAGVYNDAGLTQMFTGSSVVKVARAAIIREVISDTEELVLACEANSIWGTKL